MFKGFKEFISRGNMIDMAVGVVMGSAVTAVVNAIVKDLINPLIAMVFGKPNMDNILNISFNHATISFGGILSALLNFLLIAIAVYFFIVLPINKFRSVSQALADKMGLRHEEEAADEDKKKEETPQQVQADPQTIELLSLIVSNLESINHVSNGTASGAISDGGSAHVRQTSHSR